MKIFVAKSQQSNEIDVVNELKQTFFPKSFNEKSEPENNKSYSNSTLNIQKLHYSSVFPNPDAIKAIIFFASSKYNPAKLIQSMNSAFPNIDVFGCSTAGEIISGEMLSDSIVAMAFTDKILEDIKIEVVENISSMNQIDLVSTINSFNRHFKQPINELDTTKHFGIVLIDGNSKKEEVFLDKLGDVSHLFFIGGSAGDDLKFQQTIVYANGSSYTDAAIVAIIKSKVGFGFENLTSFSNTTKQVVATKVDEPNRIIWELNNRPALEVYCEVLNIKQEEAEKYFSLYPVALMIDGVPFIRSIRRRIGNLGLELYSNSKKDAVLHILKTEDIIINTRQQLKQIANKYENISAMILFNCIQRKVQASANNQIEEYGKLFSDIPTVGFNTYGEAFVGHINFSAAILVIE